MANRPIGKCTILAKNHTTGSDHEVIEREVDLHTQEEADHERVVRWNLAAMMQQDEETDKKLSMELGKQRPHLDAACTEDEVEQEATWCLETLRNVLDVTAKNFRNCAKSKRWWNGDIKAPRKTLRQEKGRRG